MPSSCLRAASSALALIVLCIPSIAASAPGRSLASAQPAGATGADAAAALHASATPVAVGGGVLAGGSPSVPLGGLLTAICPGDVTVECDGAGNLAERQAWLDSFTATGGCAPLTTSLTTSPGLLVSGINYPDFCDISALTRNGSTATIPNPVIFGGACVLRLTNNLSQSGSAFVTSPLSLAADASFSATFAFQITNNRGISDSDGVGADGLVFVLQSVSATVGGVGGGIGYQGIPNSLGIEFDTYDNGGQDDSDGNHLGIDVNGNVDAVVQVHVNPRFNDGNIWHAWVDYDGTTDTLEARVATTAIRPVAPSLTFTVDLPAVLGSPTAFVGFTSGTGAAAGDHDIRSLVFTSSVIPPGCPGTSVETAVFTVADSCGNDDTCQHVFSIVDTTPPSMTAGGIADCYDSVAAAEAAALLATTATDACTSSLEIGVSTVGTCDAVVTVTATDACGNAASVDYSTHVDTDAPTVLAPADEVLPCTSVPTASSPVVSDLCDPAPVVTFLEERFPGPCPADYQLRRTWTATDHCGRSASATQVIDVADTTPPTVAGGGNVLACLWPPNHWMVCFDRAGLLAGLIVDDCSEPVTVTVTGCSSDQPDNDVGDGDFAPDCIMSPDGQGFCVRAERQGTVPGGRHYTITGVAVDACGNRTGDIALGSVYVPHDQSPHEDCLKTTEVGVRSR